MIEEEKPVQFRFEAVRYRHADNAGRQALKPLLRRWLSARKIDAGVVPLNTYHDLVEIRRRRIEHLIQSGWLPELAGRRWYRPNCPPVGILMEYRRQYHPCNQTFCPFCWVRNYVYQTYDAAERVLYPDKYVKRATLDVLLLTRQHHLAAQARRPYGLDRVESVIADMRGQATLLPVPGLAGGASLWSIQLADSGEYWTIGESTLLLVPTETPSPWWPGTLERLVSPSRKQLAYSLGGLLSYPQALLIGPPEWVARLLNYRRARGGNFRTFSTYGRMRTRGQRYDEWALRQLRDEDQV